MKGIRNEGMRGVLLVSKSRFPFSTFPISRAKKSPKYHQFLHVEETETAQNHEHDITGNSSLWSLHLL